MLANDVLIDCDVIFDFEWAVDVLLVADVKDEVVLIENRHDGAARKINELGWVDGEVIKRFNRAAKLV